MKAALLKNQMQRLRRARTRARVQGTGDRPRLSVAITNRHVIAQIINDEKAVTLVYSSSMGQQLPVNLNQRAQAVGSDIAKKAAHAKIKQVVFDRGKRRYHGRVKALAEAARAGGLEF